MRIVRLIGKLVIVGKIDVSALDPVRCSPVGACSALRLGICCACPPASASFQIRFCETESGIVCVALLCSPSQPRFTAVVGVSQSEFASGTVSRR